jgi:alpha-amylase
MLQSVSLLALLSSSFALSPTEWQSKTIYQVLTDRFAKGGSESSVASATGGLPTDNLEGVGDAGCSNLSDYCGGNYAGLIDQLDYIQGMGFDAVWISPVIANTKGGYHGYWAQNLYQLNPNFSAGGKDLGDLSAALHSRGMSLMVDVVANHMGPVGYDYSSLVPFNQSSHYHDCNSGCDSNCNIPGNDFQCNDPKTKLCRLSGLPDLNQSVPYVTNTLLSWISDLVNKYQIDGLRVDTALEVNPDFWRSFVSAAGCYAVGEVEAGTPCVASYQGQALPGLLAYPFYFTMQAAFVQQQSLSETLQNFFAGRDSTYPNPELLATFVGNHDHPRFLYEKNDQTLLRSALVTQFMSVGIPIMYYGTEQALAGGGNGNDPNNRGTMWPTNYDTSAPLYSYVKSLIAIRSKLSPTEPQVQRYADDQFYAYSRANYLIAVTNVGYQGATVNRTITYEDYADGTTLCNLLASNPSSDCITVSNGKFYVALTQGMPAIYAPSM